MGNETNFQLYMLDLDMYEFLVYMYVAWFSCASSFFNL